MEFDVRIFVNGIEVPSSDLPYYRICNVAVDKIVNSVMFMFGSSITGSIYSFGYTLLIGAVFNVVIGVFLSKVMIQSLAAFKVLRKPWLFGGKRNAKNI